MPNFPIQINKILGTGGGTITIDTLLSINEYVFNGVGSLTSNWTIQPSGPPAPVSPTTVKIFFNCNFLLNGSTITIFGKTLSSQQALDGNVIIEATYDLVGADWIVVITQSAADQLPLVQGVNTRTLSAGGGTITLTPGIDNEWQELIGTTTLTSSWTVTGAATAGKFLIHYSGSLTPAGHNLTIFGLSLTQDQIANGQLFVTAEYDVINSVWRAQLSQNPNKAIANDIYPVTIPVSFEAGEQGNNGFFAPWNFKIIRFGVWVQKLIEATDDATVTIAINGVATGGTFVITAGSAINSNQAIGISVSNTGFGGDVVMAQGSKTTPGGKALIVVWLQRTA